MENDQIEDSNQDYRCYVNSLQRISGSDYNFTYYVPLPRRKQGFEFNRVALVNVSIPKTYYTVLVGQGTFQLKENGFPAISIIIPAGCYSRTGFLTYLTNILTSSSPNGWTYTTSVSNKSTGPDTGLVTYTVAGSGSSGAVQFITSDLNISDQLGLEDSSTYTFTGQNLTAPNVSVFQAEFTLFIHSDCVAEEVNVLGSIFIGSNQPDYSIITYQATHPKLQARRLVSANTTTFAFSLTDENGLVIPTNGVTLVFELLFWHEDDRLDKIINLLTVQNKILAKLAGIDLKEVNKFILPESTISGTINSEGPAEFIPGESNVVTGSKDRQQNTGRTRNPLQGRAPEGYSLPNPEKIESKENKANVSSSVPNQNYSTPPPEAIKNN